MPNWCWNVLRITGESKDDIDNVLNFIANGNNKFDLGKVIPYPDKYQRMDQRSRLFTIDLEKAVTEEEKKIVCLKYDVPEETIWLPDGYNKGGYTWCVKNWGTKWNAGNIDIAAEGNWAEISFETAWSPPTPIIYVLGKKFPMLSFCLHCEEPGNNFEGDFEVNGGVITRDETREYKGYEEGDE